MLKNKKSSSQQGAIPIILILLILLLLSSGLTVALVKILSPEPQKEIKKAEIQYEQEVKRLRTGNVKLAVTISSFSAGENTLELSYDSETIGGTITLSNNGVTVPLSVSGLINPTTGVITRGQAFGNSQISFTKGSVTAQIDGTINGVVDESGKGSGTLILSQEIVDIKGDVPQLSVGQTTSFPTINWQGTAVTK